MVWSRGHDQGLGRKDEAQRTAWEGGKILGNYSYPDSRFSQHYPIFHFLSLPHLLTQAVAGSPQGLVPMSLVWNLLAETLGLGSKRKRWLRHWDIEREQSCRQARTVAEARMSFKRAVAPPALWSQLVPLLEGWKSLKSSLPSGVGNWGGYDTGSQPYPSESQCPLTYCHKAGLSSPFQHSVGRKLCMKICGLRTWEPFRNAECH